MEDDSFLVIYNEEKHNYKYFCMKCGRDRASKLNFNKHREQCGLSPIKNWTRGEVRNSELHVESLDIAKERFRAHQVALELKGAALAGGDAVEQHHEHHEEAAAGSSAESGDSVEEQHREEAAAAEWPIVEEACTQGPYANLLMTEVKSNKQELESAIATLSEYGFSKVLIKRTLKDILWVYNGNGGWPLIKENGYEVVIERLISDNGLQQHKESNSETVKDQKLAEATHTRAAETCNTSAQHPQEDLDLEVLKAQESVDISLVQHDTKYAVLDPTGIKDIKEREGATRQSRKRGFMPQEFCEKSSEQIVAAQFKRPRTEVATNKANNVQNILEAAERLDIARMSAFKLTRRRDGGPNPMFSRLQKLKEAGAGARVLQDNDNELQKRNQSQCGEVLTNSWTAAMPSQRLQCTSDSPFGHRDPSVQNSNQSPAQESPRLPPGFEEPFVSPPESPRLPPGFWKPCGRRTSEERSLDCRDEDSRGSFSSDESPRFPPGFSELHDPIHSPVLPPGNWEPLDSDIDRGWEDCNSEERLSSPLSPDLPPGFWRSPGLAAGLSSPSAKSTFQKQVTRSPEGAAQTHREGRGCFGNYCKIKGVPPKQVFIANIPSGLEGAEQKLYNLVREILGGFQSVPISATLPRKIKVTKDHAFVEFCCEAMAGIFMDAYRANASVLRIDGEQLLAARSLHMMKADIQLGRAIANRLAGEALDPRNVFHLGNVPPKWQNEGKLLSHIALLLEGEHTSKTLSVYTIPQFSDVYVHISSSLLADTFFLQCLSEKEHLEKISASLFVCRNLSFLPRAAKLRLGS